LNFTLRAKLILVFIVGAVIREILAPFTGHPFDFEIWLRLGYYVALGQDPYNSTFPVANLSMPGSGYLPSIGYPPIWPLILAGIYKLYSILGYDNRFLYYFLLKQPMVAADLIDGFLIYRILLRISETKAFKAAAFWLLCPFTIIISSVWGMFDQIILAFLLASLLFLSKTVRSSLSESIGIILKLIPLLYVLLLSFAQKSNKKILVYLLISIGLSATVAFLPYVFFPNWSVSRVLQTGASVAGTVGNSMNYWVVLYVVTLKTTLPGSDFPTLQLLSFVWIPFVILGSFYCIKNYGADLVRVENFTVAALFVTMIFFLTRSQINEQYLIYFLGLGLLDYYLIGKSLRKKLFHAIWLDSLVFLIANNSFLLRFLDPISESYRSLETSLTLGAIGDARLAIMIATGLIFTFLSSLFLASLYSDIRARARANLHSSPSISESGSSTSLIRLKVRVSSSRLAMRIGLQFLGRS
jgi:hypothetical protein